MTPRSHEERLALNEARVREVNETIERANEKLGPAPGEDGLALSILCECGTRGCDQIVEISSAEYREVRAEPTRFVVVPGHEQAKIERVVEDKRRFAVVEKIGPAAKVAKRTDPENPAAMS
ncbi:MAG: hypothetical protein WD981_00565, partial [Gaiellaceae bacterium]